MSHLAAINNRRGGRAAAKLSNQRPCPRLNPIHRPRVSASGRSNIKRPLTALIENRGRGRSNTCYSCYRRLKAIDRFSCLVLLRAEHGKIDFEERAARSTSEDTAAKLVNLEPPPPPPFTTLTTAHCIQHSADLIHEPFLSSLCFVWFGKVATLLSATRWIICFKVQPIHFSDGPCVNKKKEENDEIDGPLPCQ